MSARVACRCCGRPAVWTASTWDEFDRDVGGRWVLATEAIRSPWQPAGTPHPVDPVRVRGRRS